MAHYHFEGLATSFGGVRGFHIGHQQRLIPSPQKKQRPDFVIVTKRFRNVLHRRFTLLRHNQLVDRF